MTSHLQWLTLADEVSKRYTNYGDGRPGDASKLIARVNSNRDLNLGYSDWRLPTVDELLRMPLVAQDSLTAEASNSKRNAVGADAIAVDNKWMIHLYHAQRYGNKYFLGRVRLVRMSGGNC